MISSLVQSFYGTVDDERQLIEQPRFDELPVQTADVREMKLTKETLRKCQRRYLLFLAAAIPSMKFILACIGLSTFFEVLGHGTMHSTKPHHLEKDEMLFLFTVASIPTSAIVLIFGTMLFSNFPRVTASTINSYITFRCVVVSLEVLAWIWCVTQYPVTFKENAALELVAVTEVYSIILLKLGSRHTFNLDPLEERSTMDRAAVETNLTKELKPGSRFAPGAIENV